MSININDDYKSYETEDLIVYWNADICEHSGICTMGLPKVFNVREKPWINVFGENTKKIIEIIEKCPSGALKYKFKKGSAIMIFKIVFENENNRSAAFYKNEEIGECTFSRSNEFWIIDHTFVIEKYNGEGIGKKLVKNVVDKAREENVKIIPLCPFALKEFQNVKEYKDILKQ